MPTKKRSTTPRRAPTPKRSATPKRGVSPKKKAAATPLVAINNKATSFLPSGAKQEFLTVVAPSSLTMGEIHKQIPAKYFNRVMWKGFAYIARDVAQAAVTMYAMYYYVAEYVAGRAARGDIDAIVAACGASAATVALVSPALHVALRALAWNAFWIIQGLNWTGLWVMAHECGHQAFSNSTAVNNAVGMVFHSFLLVPYHSWRITHGNHHKNTNHLFKDTVFVPLKRSEVLRESVDESPIIEFMWMVITFTVGWPAYLLGNFTGQTYSRPANHFNPNSPLFQPEEYNDVILSDIGLLTMFSAIGAAIYNFGFQNVACYYFVPYLWVNFWLVFITYLQHTDIRLPHYNDSDWTFVRGALATVDRDFGFILNSWLHHINDSHVVHHIFSQMPFYNAIAVTRNHVKDILKENYLSSNKTLWTSLWDSWLECKYVVPSEGISVYHK